MFLGELTPLLTDSHFIRKLDLRNNRVGALSPEFLEALHINESLICLDLRHNKCVSNEEARRKVALCLLKNIDIARKGRDLLCPSWLNKEILCLTRKEMPSLARGLNLVIRRGEDESSESGCGGGTLGSEARESLFDHEETTINLQVKQLQRRSSSRGGIASKSGRSPSASTSKSSAKK